MTPSQLKKLRLDQKVSLLDVAARTGLPAEYIAKIEDEEIIALESDLARIHKGILQAAKELAQREKDDFDKIDIDRLLDEDE